MAKSLSRAILFFLLAVFYAFVLWFVEVKAWWGLTLLICANFILGRRGLWLVILVSFWDLIFDDGMSNLKDRLVYHVEAPLIFSSDNALSIPTWDFRLVMIFICFFGVISLIWLFKFFSTKNDLLKVLTLVLLFPSMLFVFEKALNSTLTTALWTPALVLSGHLIIFLMLFQGQVVNLSFEQNLKKLVFFVPPIWMTPFFSYTPRERLDWRDYWSEDVEEEWRCRISGFMLIGLGFLNCLIYHWVRHFTFSNAWIDRYIPNIPSLNLPNPNITGFNFIMNLDLPVWQLWAIVLSHGLGFLLSYVGTYGPITFGTARILGFRLHSNVTNPFSAISFGDFINRILYYYVYFIATAFYFPLLSFFKKFIHHRMMAQFLSVLLAICLGGSFYHLVRDIEIFLQSGLNETLRFRLEGMPYFIALSLAIAFSKYYRIPRTWRNQFLTRLPFVIFYFCLYSFILMMHTNISNNSFSDRLRFFGALFGIS